MTKQILVLLCPVALAVGCASPEELEPAADTDQEGSGDGWADSDEAEAIETDGPAPTADPDADFSAAADPSEIGGETPSAFDGVRRVSDYYTDPLFSSVSYASVSIPGCSATLVGPNILMTAAHCGADSALTITATARVYTGRSLFSPRTESFTCNLLFHTFPESDLAIYHCPNNALGAPGDRYGYLGIDHAEIEPDEWLGSVWTNSINNLGISAASLLSIGYVDAPQSGGHWFTPRSPVGAIDSQCNTNAAEVPVGTKMDIWTNNGASGSSHFDLGTGDVRVGPLSTGTAEALDRNALSMRDYLYYGYIYPPQSTCGRNNTVNASYVNSLGLDPTDYTGRWADVDLNWFFDLVEDVEDAAGENRRNWYYLGFGNRRRARLWETGPHATIDDDAGRVEYNTHPSLNSTQLLARHDGLNMIDGQRYQVAFNASSTYAHSWYRVCLQGTWTTCSSWWKDGDPELRSRSVMLTAPDNVQSVLIQGWNAQGSIEDVQVTRVRLMTDPGTPPEDQLFFQDNDFDTFDERQAWFHPTTGAPVTILPDGNGGGINWAGRVVRNTFLSGARFELATDGFAFPADEDYELCFMHRDDPTSPLIPAASGFVRVVDDEGLIIANTLFGPDSIWSSRCMSFSVDPGAAHNLRLEFGTTAGFGALGGAYLLDKVSIRYKPFD